MVNISFVGALIGGLTFTDKVDIYRFEDSTKPNGAVRTQLPDEPTYSDVDCKVSFSLRSYERFKNDSLDTVPYDKQPKLLFYSNTDIKEGDYIEAKKMQGDEVIATYKGQCGLPNVLDTHIEVILNIHGDS